MMENFTLIELHLDDARFSNVVGGEEEADLAEEMLDEMDVEIEAEAEESGDESGSGSGRGIVRRLVVLGILVFAARAAMRRMGSDEDVDYDVAVEEMDDVESTA